MTAGITRRELVRRGGLLSLVPAFLRGGTAAAEPAAAPALPAGPGLRPGPEIYQSIGVRPVRQRARHLHDPHRLDDAAGGARGDGGRLAHYVHLDELAEAVGKRLAELTQAEWGMVTVGCSAALTHATAACVDRRQPGPARAACPTCAASRRTSASSRSTRATSTTPRCARWACRWSRSTRRASSRPPSARAPRSPTSSPARTPTRARRARRPSCEAAKKRGVPVLVDAAAEILTVPNVHLQLGATLVGYSGGKCLRGPQAAGLLLGRKDLVKAAWVGSAPHHGFGRGFKVGKEEAIGMLMAVEMWMKRDHEAEWKQWAVVARPRSRAACTAVPGVTTTRRRSPRGSRTACRRCRSAGTATKLGRSAASRRRGSSSTATPRIVAVPGAREAGATRDRALDRPLHDGGRATRRSSPSGCSPSSRARAARRRSRPRRPRRDLTGSWDVRIEYAASALHPRAPPAPAGERARRHAPGRLRVARARAARSTATPSGSAAPTPSRHGDSLNFTFTGTLAGRRDVGQSSTWASTWTRASRRSATRARRS